MANDPSQDNKWYPESLLDYLLASKKHSAFSKCFGGYEASYQPSEFHIQKSIPDRILWIGDSLVTIELKISVDSLVCSQLEIQRAAAIAFFIEHGPSLKNYKSKYEFALNSVKNYLLTIYHPSNYFTQLLTQEGFQIYSIENGIKTKSPLDYSSDPVPLIIADLRYKLSAKKTQQLETLEKNIEKLLNRQFTVEERLFIARYPILVHLPHQEQLKSLHMKFEEVKTLTETEFEQILKEKLFLLSPEERMKGLTLEERMKGLTPEEEKKLLKLLKDKLEKEQG